MPKHYIEEDLGPDRRDAIPPFVGSFERDVILEAEYACWAEAKMDECKPFLDPESTSEGSESIPS